MSEVLERVCFDGEGVAVRSSVMETDCVLSAVLDRVRLERVGVNVEVRSGVKDDETVRSAETE